MKPIKPTRRAVAIHEAAHALADYLLGFSISWVTIIPTIGRYGAACATMGRVESIIRFADRLVSILAGPEATELLVSWDEFDWQRHRDGDEAEVTEIVAKPWLKHMASRLRRNARRRARRLVEDPVHIEMIESLAKALLRKGELSGQEVTSIFALHKKMPARARKLLADWAEITEEIKQNGGVGRRTCGCKLPGKTEAAIRKRLSAPKAEG